MDKETKTYIKTSETTFEERVIIPEKVIVNPFKLNELKDRLNHTRIRALNFQKNKDFFDGKINETNSEIADIEALILKAEELGVKELVEGQLEVPKEIVNESV